MCLFQISFVFLTAEHSKLLMVKNYFCKGANGLRSSNETATFYCAKRVKLVELRICVLLKVVNIPQFKTSTQNPSLT